MSLLYRPILAKILEITKMAMYSPFLTYLSLNSSISKENAQNCNN